MKITRIFGVVSLLVFLVGAGIAGSHDITLARENGQTESASNQSRVVVRESGDDQSNALLTAADDGDDDSEGRSGNVTVSSNRSGREGDDRNEGEQRGSRSRQPVPPVVTPPTSNTTSNATIVSYSQVIQPILNQRCNSCHPKPGVNLSTYAGTKAAVNLLPGMGQSYLSAAERQSLLTWIQQGALNN